MLIACYWFMNTPCTIHLCVWYTNVRLFSLLDLKPFLRRDCSNLRSCIHTTFSHSYWHKPSVTDSTHLGVLNSHLWALSLSWGEWCDPTPTPIPICDPSPSHRKRTLLAVFRVSACSLYKHASIRFSQVALTAERAFPTLRLTKQSVIHSYVACV